MNSKLKISFLVIAFLVPAAYTTSNAQERYTSGHGKTAKMKLSGTSTMHDWEMNSGSMTSDARFAFAPGNPGKLTGLTALFLELTVQTLKSGKVALDKNAYKALKMPTYKHIVYRLTSATVMPEKNNRYQIKTTGDLSIAGITRSIHMDVYCMLNSDRTITCTGSEKLKMTDYQVNRLPS